MREKGFVIILVLFFMQICSLLEWYAMHDVILLSKFSNNILAHDLMVYQADRILSQIEWGDIFDGSTCMIAVTAPDAVVAEPLAWWQSHGCSGSVSTFRYYYVLESMGVDPCAMVDRFKKTMAAWFRVTLFLQSEKNEVHLFLQGTAVRPDTTRPKQCPGIIHTVSIGPQARRELDEQGKFML